jgi:uncharacterized membrane protein YjgN (DUF898 family)
LNQPKYVLEIRYADGSSISHEISEERRIVGRSKVKADLQINDKKSSGRHCEIRFVGGTITVRDMGSTNGTVHNGQKSEQFALGPGGSFRIGDTTLRIMALHGVEEEDGRTVVGAPAWIEDDESTRALSAEQVALVTGHAPPDVETTPEPEPAAPVKQSPRQTVAYHPALTRAPLRPDPDPAPEYDAPPEPEPETATAPAPDNGYDEPIDDAEPPDWAVAAAAPDPSPHDQYQQQMVVEQQPAWESPGGSAGLPAGPIQFDFTATGGQVFKKLFLGQLLCMVTLGIYTPWFIVSLQNWWYDHLQIQGNRGQFQARFEGTGGKLFVKFIGGYLLTLLTLFIYTPWFVCGMIKWFTENTKVTDPDGNEYDIEFTLTGGELFKFAFINGLLLVFTAGIWGSWYFCRMQNLMMSHHFISQNGRRIGTLEFTGKGGKLFVLVFVNYLLTIVTFGIYAAWFAVKLMRYVQENTTIHVNKTTWSGRFSGTGGQLFKLYLSALLIPLTLGIYVFWWKAKMWRFDWKSKSFEQS